ncbi:DUF349 domain-containing protein [Micrococcoides hystricis]|uniref:DUF349 domain-containing protein n=1 Tax=Micrococcoides hystricis TaxID=1572761 RepID=A0ABV6P7J1_9MICC
MTERQQSDETNKPRPPAVPSPAAFAKKKPALPVVPAATSDFDAEAAHAFGSVSEDGHVSVKYQGETVPVGQYPDATNEEALDYFVRKFEDAHAQLVLLEQRVKAGAKTSDITKAVETLQSQLEQKNMVGDIADLESRLESLTQDAAKLAAEQKEQAAARVEQEKANREAIVAEAEQIADTDVKKIMWKQSTARMNELFDLWKASQKTGPRLGKAVEDALWKRFRAARTQYDKQRRAFFSQLDVERAEVKRVKEKLIAEAEAMSDSTDWGPTAAAYRNLMDRWKKAGRASRNLDDALWARFRAAQDKFFDARQAVNAEVEKELQANRDVKEALLERAQQLLPVQDLAATKKALGQIQDEWEEAGRVPRADLNRLESGLRKVENAVKAAEDEQWRRTDPEIEARANSALNQLRDSISELEKELADAQASGDAKKIAAAEEALEARQQWLATIEAATE